MGLFDVLFKRNELAKEVQSLEARKNALLQDIATQEHLKSETESKVLMQLSHLEELRSAVGTLSGIVEMQDMGLEYVPLDTNKQEISEKIVSIEDAIARMYSDNKTCDICKSYTVNNSVSKGKQLQKEYCTNLLGAYNIYFEKKKKIYHRKQFFSFNRTS